MSTATPVPWFTKRRRLLAFPNPERTNGRAVCWSIQGGYHLEPADVQFLTGETVLAIDYAACLELIIRREEDNRGLRAEFLTSRTHYVSEPRLSLPQSCWSGLDGLAAAIMDHFGEPEGPVMIEARLLDSIPDEEVS